MKKPNAYKKLWKIITKSELGEYQEEPWLKLLSLQEARTIGEWRNMEEEIIYCVERYPVCQLHKQLKLKVKAKLSSPIHQLTLVIKYRWIFSDHCQPLGQGITTYYRLKNSLQNILF